MRLDTLYTVNHRFESFSPINLTTMTYNHDALKISNHLRILLGHKCVDRVYGWIGIFSYLKDGEVVEGNPAKYCLRECKGHPDNGYTTYEAYMNLQLYHEAKE